MINKQKPKKIKMDKEQLLNCKKQIKKHQAAIKAAELKIYAIKQSIISELCPHKVGDKCQYKQRKKDEIKEAWVKRIYFYTFSFPMKFQYEYGSTPDVGGYHNTINFMHYMEIIWPETEQPTA